MTTFREWLNTALIIVVGLLVLVGGQSADFVGGTRYPNGISADGTEPSAGEVRGTTLTVTGASTQTGAITATGGITVGSSGTATSQLKWGNCTIFAYATTITASSTATVDCQAGAAALTAISGITSTDTVIVQATSSMPTTFQGLQIIGANASSTDGFIVMDIYNGTGDTFTWTNTASTAVKYLDLN